MPIDTPSAAAARRLQSEGELYEAFTTGLLCAVGAAKAIGMHRSEGRWFQLSMVLEGLRQSGVRLALNKRKPGLLMPDGRMRT